MALESIFGGGPQHRPMTHIPLDPIPIPPDTPNRIWSGSQREPGNLGEHPKVPFWSGDSGWRCGLGRVSRGNEVLGAD